MVMGASRLWLAMLMAIPCVVVAAPGDEVSREKLQPVDVTTIRSQLIVLADDLGTLYVARPPASDELPELFIGTPGTLYAQRIIGSSADGSAGTWSYSAWGPRARGGSPGSLRHDGDKKFWLSCDRAAAKDVELTRLAPAESEKVLSSAVFLPPFWRRQTHVLARDELGTYYFVDQLRGGRGFRIFVGKPGAMKQVPMRNVVLDSAGAVFSTRRGDLHFIANADRTAYWIKGRKKTPLSQLDAYDNRRVIYRDLGVYGFLGSICEDY
jgi:hypothetical protein